MLVAVMGWQWLSCFQGDFGVSLLSALVCTSSPAAGNRCVRGVATGRDPEEAIAFPFLVGWGLRQIRQGSMEEKEERELSTDDTMC